MGIEPDMVCERGISDDHFTPRNWLAQAGHRIRYHFKMVRQKCQQLAAQRAQCGCKNWRLGRDVGVNIQEHGKIFWAIRFSIQYAVIACGVNARPT